MRIPTSSSSSVFSISSSPATFLNRKSSSLLSSLFLSTSSISNSRNSMSFKGMFSTNLVSDGTRRISAVSATTKTDDGRQTPSSKRGDSFFRSVLAGMEEVYLKRNATAKAVLELVRSADDDQIRYDHFAFRTFGVDDHGIESMAKFFLDFGYTQREELRFPAKKLKAYWFSPPSNSLAENGSGVNGPLPRVFISELLVDQMSSQSQEIIKKYTRMSGNGNNHTVLASVLGSLTWQRPLYSDFQQLASESEYAAWTLVNGYALNHVTISTHQLKSNLRSIISLNQFIEKNGFKLNSEGGVLKVSPDGLLLQSSTVADSISFQFSDGVTEVVPCSYIEFAERLVLPQYRDLPEKEVREFHRRDGFEVGNADKIFESTSKDQLTRRAA